MQKNSLIVGFGHLGQMLAPLLLAQGDSVWGMSRHHGEKDVTPLYLDLDEPLILDWKIPKQTHIYYLAPPPGRGDDDPRLKHFLTWLAGQQTPAKLLYISTTGVYGDCQGEWIDESAPIKPESDRAKRRWAAERQLTEWCLQHSVPLVIFRVAGIYGPRTLPLARVAQGTVVVRPEQATFTNRIHVEDLARVCVVAMKQDTGIGIFNVADGNPSTMADYFNLVARTFDLPLPEMIDAAAAPEKLSPAMMSFLRESKRIRNDKLCRDLDFEFLYPTLELGMSACAKAIGHSAGKE